MNCSNIIAPGEFHETNARRPFLLLISANAYAAEVAGVTLDPAVSVNEKALTLNGYGIRKFFFKVYIGIYLKQVSSPAELLQNPDDKLSECISCTARWRREDHRTFAEGFAKNSRRGGLRGCKTFLSFFSNDFVGTPSTWFWAPTALSSPGCWKVLGALCGPRSSDSADLCRDEAG